MAPETSRIGREAETKRVDKIQKRRRDQELERQKLRPRMENEPALPMSSVQDPYDPFERSVTLKEALALGVEDIEMGRKGGTDIGATSEEKDFA